MRVIVVQGFFDGRISGRLVRPDRTPVPGVTVQARRDDWPGQSSRLEQSALTRDDGAYQIVKLPPGRYRLAINADSDFRGRPYRAPTYHPGVAGMHEATVIDLAGGQQITVDDLVVPMAVGLVTLRGTVLGVDGRPVAGARVYVEVPSAQGSDRLVGQPAPTGPDGRFAVTVGDEDRYRLIGEFGAPGSFLKGEAIVGMADAAAPVTIRLTPAAGSAALSPGPDGKRLRRGYIGEHDDGRHPRMTAPSGEARHPGSVDRCQGPGLTQCVKGPPAGSGYPEREGCRWHS